MAETVILRAVSSLLRWLVAWSYLGLVALAFLPVMLVLWPSRARRIRAFGVFGRLTGRVMIFFAGGAVAAEVPHHLRKVQPAIFVCNHTSYLDNFVAAWASPPGTVATARRSTIWVPFFGQLYALSGNVLVEREDPRQAVVALRTLTALVQQHGLSAMVWPEGTRSVDGRLQPFRRGFVHLALATRLPVVPIVISGAHHCWPKGSWITQRACVDIQVLSPIDTKAWKVATIEQHVAEVRERFLAALPLEQRS